MCVREGPCFFHSSLGGPGLAPRTFSVRAEPCGLVPQRLYVGRWNGTPGPCVARVRVAIHGRCNGTDFSLFPGATGTGGRGHCACVRATALPNTCHDRVSCVPCRAVSTSRISLDHLSVIPHFLRCRNERTHGLVVVVVAADRVWRLGSHAPPLLLRSLPKVKTPSETDRVRKNDLASSS